jgi:hypothetical protein
MKPILVFAAAAYVFAVGCSSDSSRQESSNGMRSSAPVVVAPAGPSPSSGSSSSSGASYSSPAPPVDQTPGSGVQRYKFVGKKP